MTAITAGALLILDCNRGSALTYVVPDTDQTECYDNARAISCPNKGAPFYGQDAQQEHFPPAYQDNGDGTITDLNTRLTWVKARGSKMTWDEAMGGADACDAGGFTDWRAPTIKELYSLIQFSGYCGASVAESAPFLDVNYFEFAYGDPSLGERIIDCQDWSATEYVSTTMNGDATAFGVNFADGRIKGYPKFDPRTGTGHKLYVRYVRGNPEYGVNKFVDHGDGTISDLATGLMWSQADSGQGLNWQDALAWVQSRNAENHLGYSDWRLPHPKELQSIVDYTRSPDTTNSPAIDPLFLTTTIGDNEYPFFWTGATHVDGPDLSAAGAVYVAFGRGLGWMEMPPLSGHYQLLDVHGAGCQRSDPKSGDPADYPYGRGPQGDVVRIFDFVRLVRGPFAPADIDFDGFVSQADMDQFAACATGPGIPYDPRQLPDGCELQPDTDGKIVLDFEPDGDIDHEDFGRFQLCISGSDAPADPDC